MSAHHRQAHHAVRRLEPPEHFGLVFESFFHQQLHERTGLGAR
jgi:hypothetical protein